ncbi:hypothetical protein DFP72DRAFT_940422 [Ephemerocybe angulata]|uniref:Secreted protein n=1 Tax=Ephemerocybe angulata TaxID=980116 RepID=A0A8H6H7Y0_9AGAR|nr:hypothetical protein DFP72DRAFT_940422 [Tulosesus angulatus]
MSTSCRNVTTASIDISLFLLTWVSVLGLQHVSRPRDTHVVRSTRARETTEGKKENDEGGLRGWTKRRGTYIVFAELAITDAPSPSSRSRVVSPALC